MAEKREIVQDLQQEEERLDAMMEVHRLNGVKQAEINEEIKQKQRRQGAREILEQIKLNTENRLLEEEKKNAESQALISLVSLFQKFRNSNFYFRYMEQLQQEDLAELANRHEQVTFYRSPTSKPLLSAKCNKPKSMRSMLKLKSRKRDVLYKNLFMIKR